MEEEFACKFTECDRLVALTRSLFQTDIRGIPTRSTAPSLKDKAQSHLAFEKMATPKLESVLMINMIHYLKLLMTGKIRHHM